MSGIEISNYDIHKQALSLMEPPSEDYLQEKLSNMGGWFSANLYNKYYMLMCRERYDFTVFHFNNMNYTQGLQEIRELLESRGIIMDISYIHGEDAYECWIKDAENECCMYYLFPYDFGVIEIGEV